MKPVENESKVELEGRGSKNERLTVLQKPHKHIKKLNTATLKRCSCTLSPAGWHFHLPQRIKLILLKLSSDIFTLASCPINLAATSPAVEWTPAFTSLHHCI